MSENIDVHRGVKTREVAKKKSEGRERRVYKLGSTGECLLFQCSISEPVQAPHTAALTPPHKEVTDGVTESSLFQSGYKNNSLYLKEKKLRQKRPFFFFSSSPLIAALPLAHVHAYTGASLPSATEIWLRPTRLYRSQSEKDMRASSGSLAPFSQVSQRDSNRFHQRTQRGVITSNPWPDKSVST